MVERNVKDARRHEKENENGRKGRKKYKKMIK